MRRWLGAVSVLAMFAGILVGCADGPASDTEKAPLVAAADMKTVTLSVKGMT